MRLSLPSGLPSLVLSMVSLTALSLSAIAQDAVESKDNDPLTTYQGKNRVVLVFGTTDTDPKFSQQISALKNKAELDDRQIVVLPVPGDDKAAGKSLPYLQKKYNEGSNVFSLVLIGKDGHTAFQSSEPVSAEALYAKIDAMPMRKDEVKEKSEEADKTRGLSKTEEQKDN